MKIRKQKKYFWLNIPCAHQHDYVAWYVGDIETTCKASKNGDENIADEYLEAIAKEIIGNSNVNENEE